MGVKERKIARKKERAVKIKERQKEGERSVKIKAKKTNMGHHMDRGLVISSSYIKPSAG